MPSSSRIVFAEDLVDVAPWRPVAIEGERRAGAERRAAIGRRVDDVVPAGPTYEDGLRDGYARGLEEAQLAMQAEHASRLEAIARRGDALFGSFTAQLAAVQGTMADELVTLAVEIARSAFGAALRVRDDAVVPAVTAALAGIVDEHARPILRLHPDDAVLVAEQLAPMLAARGVQLLPDDTVEAGGCRVDTPRASIDASVRTRWRRALEAIGRDYDWVQA